MNSSSVPYCESRKEKVIRQREKRKKAETKRELRKNVDRKKYIKTHHRYACILLGSVKLSCFDAIVALSGVGSRLGVREKALPCAHFDFTFKYVKTFHVLECPINFRIL